MRQYRMGLIQTAEQLRFSYIAIVEGAKQMGCLPEDALSDLKSQTVPAATPAPMQIISHPQITTFDSSSSSDGYDDDDLSLSDDDDNAPPLPPRRSESLMKSNLNGNNGLDSFVNMPTILQGMLNLFVYFCSHLFKLKSWFWVHFLFFENLEFQSNFDFIFGPIWSFFEHESQYNLWNRLKLFEIA